MKQLTRKDLKEGEIYRHQNNTILKWGIHDSVFNITSNHNAVLKKNGGYYGNKIYYEATPEEKHWLEECIKVNNFISKEEALKSFIPEYVECISKSTYDWGTNIIGKIYKVVKRTPIISNAHYRIEYNGQNYPSVSVYRFKPSTKEAYEAQFIMSKILSETSAIGDEGCIFKIGDNVTYSEDNNQFNMVITHFKLTDGKVLVNDNNIDINDLSLVIDTFKLPEKWCIKWSNKENFKIIQNYLENIVRHDWTYDNEYIHSKAFVNYKNDYFGPLGNTPRGYEEITFEQFKKYVLNENN